MHIIYNKLIHCQCVQAEASSANKSRTQHNTLLHIAVLLLKDSRLFPPLSIFQQGLYFQSSDSQQFSQHQHNFYKL